MGQQISTKTSINIKVWVSNYVPVKRYDWIMHPRPNVNVTLAKPPLKLVMGWVITSDKNDGCSYLFTQWSQLSHFSKSFPCPIDIICHLATCVMDILGTFSIKYLTSYYHIDELVWEKRSSIARALELRLSCTKSSIWLKRMENVCDHKWTMYIC